MVAVRESFCRLIPLVSRQRCCLTRSRNPETSLGSWMLRRCSLASVVGVTGSSVPSTARSTCYEGYVATKVSDAHFLRQGSSSPLSFDLFHQSSDDACAAAV